MHVMWQLTEQVCELLEGIRCADSLVMGEASGQRHVRRGVNGEKRSAGRESRSVNGKW